ncbi:hypothetical protein BU25DRAFT_469759 [Macroventuria anomochaeta]|uniref:Uncharacterized protein n=1 Tax=Macroventuria anomochaeta TaxID=301207 RepID=A0ACB6RXY1_9PLEO|nr:uncharacterized protein BU25DRAFT_469759 [Macroventuria anomochaeta]KAF2626771.1 hypothetical protein BU25DRAFT_469759 [Macroventuria anomochaeta]
MFLPQICSLTLLECSGELLADCCCFLPIAGARYCKKDRARRQSVYSLGDSHPSSLDFLIHVATPTMLPIYQRPELQKLLCHAIDDWYY